MMWRFLLVWLTASLACSDLCAQAPGLYFEKLTTQNGLSHNKVNCVVQDRRGFMWFGTDDGLNRYDGYNFIIFRHEPGNPTSISGNMIKDIVEDEQGVIWIATGDGGLTRYDYKLPPARQFKQYKHSPGDTASIPTNIINSLLIDPYGFLWLGTSNQRALRFDRKKEKFSRPEQRGTRTILDMCLDHTGIIWAGREGGGILKINPRTMQAQMDSRYTNLYAEKLPHAAVTALYADKDNNVWFGSWDKVLYRQRPQSDSEEVFARTDSRFSFANDQIDCFTEDTQGHLWMGGRYNGLHMYDKKTGHFFNYQYDPSREGTIADNHINCLYRDRSGRIWLGTNKGLSVNHPLQQQFMQTFLPDVNTRGNAVTIYDFYKHDNGDLWIGTSAGIYIRRAADHAFVHRPVFYKGNKLSVTKFYRDIDNTFYIGTNYSLFVYDMQKDTIALLPNTEKDTVMSRIYESRVVSVVRDSIEGRPVLLVSPYGHYLTYYDLFEKRWVSRTDTVKKIVQRFNLQDYLIRKIFKCHNNKIWLANTQMGLGIWNRTISPKIEYLYNDPAKPATLSNNNVYDIDEDQQDNLWISTYGGGLNCLHTKTRQLTHISSTNNLLEGLQIDERGSVWMISNGNLHKYDPLRRSYVSFNLPDIDKSGGVRGYMYKDKQGHLYAAGTNYFIEFDPLAIRDIRELPEVVLTDFKIFNQSYSDLLLKDKITLRYNQNYFRIEFAAPDFAAGRRIQYSYMLQGRDNNWVATGNQNFEQFSNLPGGDYVFKVRATNNTGVWSKSAVIRIVIIPPFWKTWWFYALCAVACAGIIYAIYRYRINELLKVQAIRNKIAQDLHDNVGSTLSSISVYSQVAKIYNQQARSGELQQTLEKIGSTSGEMISEMNDIVWAINPRHDNMNTILQRMESYARPLLASQGITFQLTADPGIKNINLEMNRRKNFYLIFKESVNNALKYAHCKSIQVNINLKHHQLELVVQDDGIGFDMQQVQIHASQSLSGNGLRNMEIRAAEMKGVWQMYSQPGKGTRVYLRFSIT
jgi:ligand-binding sensor domain-containing protein/signal transduction histidine kinase